MDEIKNILKRLYNNDPKLYEVNVSDFQDGGNSRIWDLNAAYTQDFADILKINTVLSSLNLKCIIDSASFNNFVDALQVNKTLKNLTLSTPDNNGTVILANALKTNTTLRYLRLFNSISEDVGAIALAEALNINTALENLILDYNCISYKGACALANSLINNSTLIHLNVTENEIGDEGAIAIANALKKNKTLEYLNCSHGKFGNSGALAFSEMLLVNNTLKKLEICGQNAHNNYDVVGVEAIAKSLIFNTSLKELDLTFELDYQYTDDDEYYPHLDWRQLFEPVLAHNYTLVTLLLNYKPTGTLERYLERNKLIANYIDLLKSDRPSGEPLSLNQIHDMRHKLELLVPELKSHENPLPDTHPIAEGYRMLNALKQFHLGVALNAFDGLIKPFIDPDLQNVADEFMSMVLTLLSVQFKDAPNEIKIAYYQLIAFSAKSDVDAVEYIFAIAGLENPDNPVVSFTQPDNADDVERFNYSSDVLQTIRKQVFDWLHRSTPTLKIASLTDYDKKVVTIAKQSTEQVKDALSVIKAENKLEHDNDDSNDQDNSASCSIK